MSDVKIIFLHGFWRSSSTYFWNKFRSFDKTISFYEPFHENLDRDLKEFTYQSSRNWQSNHPYVEDYWSEYRSLGLNPSELFTQNNGAFVKGDYYYLTDEKKSYIKKLIDISLHKKYENIIFGCVRSVAIVKPLKQFIEQNYPNVNQSHIFFDRSPLNQFESFVSNSFYHKNKYFLSINVLPLIFSFSNLAKLIDFDLKLDNKNLIQQNLQKVSQYSELLITPNLSFYKAFLMNKYISLSFAENGFDQEFKLENFDNKENLNFAEKYFSKIINKKIDFSDFETPKSYFLFKKEIIKYLSEEVRDILLRNGKITPIQNQYFSSKEDIDLIENQYENNNISPNEFYLETVKKRFNLIEKEILNQSKKESTKNVFKEYLNKILNLSIKKIFDKIKNIFK